MFSSDGLPERKKSEISNFLLQGNVEDRWTLHAAKAEGVSFVTWKEFKKAFWEKYYPRSFCDVKRNEFISLVKDNMAVEEHEKRFT